MIDRIYIYIGLLVCAFAMAAFVPAIAGDNSREIEKIEALNKRNPLQNPDYERTNEVVKRRVLDRKNKTVGEITDILLSERSGRIVFLLVDFNRLRFTSEVFINTREMDVRSVSGDYALPYSADEIEKLYPDLLANIETAAGNEDIFSIEKIMGAAVRSSSGKVLGKVSEVLFNNSGDCAVSILVKLKNGRYRGKRVAMPFSLASFKDVGAKKEVIFPDSIIESMLKFAK